MMDKTQALAILAPTAKWVIRDAELEWLSTDIIQPTEAEITAEITRLQDIYDSQEYARARATEYAALNQFEMQFDDQVNGTTTWVDAINDIKARFPK